MHRFFLPPGAIQDGTVDFPAGTARQISRVLRLKPGQHVAVLDNLGMEYLVELTAVENHHVLGMVAAAEPAAPEPKVELNLYLCLSQREKFEWMLQKCTEIGAANFTPVISSRTLVQETESKTGRSERWQNILREAAEQSGRGRIPRLAAPLAFELAVRQAVAENDLVLFPTIGLPGRAALGEALGPWRGREQARVGLFIGPEGGFSGEEAGLAVSAGCLAVDLGRRVLRMETAAVSVTAIIMHAFGELG